MSWKMAIFARAPNVWSAKCLGAKCPRPPIFQGANCPYSQMSRSQMSWVPIVQSANCPGAKCPKRQMSGAKCPGAGWRAPFVSLPYFSYTIIQISRYSNMLQMCRALCKCVPRFIKNVLLVTISKIFCLKRIKNW